jgi:hypothetical protein
MDERQTCSPAEALRDAVDALLDCDPGSLSGVEVARMLADVEVQRRRLEAVDQRLVAEVAQRGIAAEYARTSPVDLLVELLRITPREARARVGRADDLGPRRALTGEPLGPLFAATADAVRAGEVSAAQADVITGALDRVSQLGPAALPVAEALLVEAARHQHAKELARTASVLLARLDPDGLEPGEEQLERRRGFSLAKLPDGSAIPRGRWTAELVALWEPILDALAAPHPGEDGIADQRSAAQRRHDAMAEAAGRLLRSGVLPPAGGAPVTVLAVTTVAELAAGAGVAVTGHGEQLSIARLLAMSGEAQVLPVVCNQSGGIVAYGRGRRLASTGQRLALAARDRGCCFPGCNRPAAWTEVHHIRDWADGGGTDIDNLCLLCRFHHRYFARFGWEAVMIDGTPHWRPPAWLDPHRRPRRNTAHHLADFDFRGAA